MVLAAPERDVVAAGQHVLLVWGEARDVRGPLMALELAQHGAAVGVKHLQAWASPIGAAKQPFMHGKSRHLLPGLMLPAGGHPPVCVLRCTALHCMLTRDGRPVRACWHHGWVHLAAAAA